MRTLSPLLAVAVVVCASLGVARAQDKAAAEAAFQQAQRLLDAGDVAGACDAFATSQQLDPQFGTQYNLAVCFEKVGKLASAYGEFTELGAKDTNTKRRAKAKDKAKALAPRLTRLTLTVSDPPPALAVARDGVDITVLVGVTAPVDPGVYTFTATAPGRQPWSQQVDLTAEGATITVAIPPLAEVEEPFDDPEADDGDAIEPVRDGGGADGAGAERPLPPPPPPASGGRRILTLSLLGGGGIAVGLGAVFGIQAAGLKDDAESACGGTLDPCGGDLARAEGLIDDARGKAMLSNVLVGVGVVAIAAGVYLWATEPDGAERPAAALVPVVGEQGVGVVLDGRF